MARKSLKMHGTVISNAIDESTLPFVGTSIAGMKLFVAVLLVDVVSSITIGRIDNCAYASVNASVLRRNGTTCRSCLCEGWSRFTPPFLVLNCFNNGQQCELYSNYSTPFSMISNQSSTFYFYPDLPPIVSTLGIHILPVPFCSSLSL